MSKQSYKELLRKYQEGIATEEELQLLEQYADQMINQSDFQVFFSEEDKEQIKQELSQRVRINQTPRWGVWTRIAASIILVAGLSLSFWFAQQQWSGPELATITTAVGEHKTVKLPDGSEVMLNAMSSITYPEVFDNEERTVTLKGEAQFNVAKDAGRPFEVLANSVKTTVLGTIFNINAYSTDSLVTVSLIEGSVKVDGFGTTNTITPNQEAYFNLKDRSSGVRQFEAANITAWQNGDLILSRTSFAQLQRILKRQYGVELELSHPEMAQYTVSGKFYQPDINTLLTSVCAAKSLKFKTMSTDQYLIY